MASLQVADSPPAATVAQWLRTHLELEDHVERATLAGQLRQPRALPRCDDPLRSPA